MQYIPSIVLWAAIIGWVIYTVFIKKSRNLSAAQRGEDKDRVKQAINRFLGTADAPQIVYAHWEERESYGRTVKTTYYRYAVAFQSQTMWVFPLHVDKKTHQVQAGEPTTLTAEKLGKVTVLTKEKDGAVNHVEVWLGDKQGHAIFQLYVDAQNLRKNRWFPLNILQQEECAAFARFISPLAQRVADENPGVDALMAAEASEGYGIIGAGLSIGGAIGGLFFPPLGALLCLIGLILSVVGKVKGAKKNKCLIISIVCAVWTAVFMWVYFQYMLV